MKKNEISMSKEYPYILLIKLLAYFDYQSGILMHNGVIITTHAIGDILNVSSTTFIYAMSILKTNNIAEIVEINGKKFVSINTDIVKAIKKVKSLKI